MEDLPEGFTLVDSESINKPTEDLPEGFTVVGEQPEPTATSSEGDNSIGIASYLQGNEQPTAELSGITDYSNTKQPTTNSDGTVSTITTGQPDVYDGAFNDNVIDNTKDYAQQEVAGARKLTAGLAKIVNDGLAEAGLPNEKEVTDKVVKTLNDYTERYNKKNPDQAIHPSTIGNLLAYSVVPFGATLKSATAAGGAIGFVDAIGNNKDYGEATIDAAIGAVLAGGSQAILSKLFNGFDKLSTQAKLLVALNQGRKSETQVLKELKGMPKEDQLISIAESLDLAKNYFKAAVGDDSKLAAKLGARLEARQKTIKPFIADDVEVADAKASYKVMKEELDSSATGTYSTEAIQTKLDDKFIDLYATDPSGLGTALKKIKLDISEPISAGQALDIIENINSILRKPTIRKDYKTSKALGEIKDSLKAFMDTAVDPKLMASVNQNIAKYRETINRQKFGELFRKHTKADYATNWEGLLKDVKKEGLGGQNIDFVIPILKEFEAKFHNDKYLAEAITINGSSKGLSFLGAFSAAIGKAYDILSPILNRSRYKDLQIRKAIIKSIRRGDTKSPTAFLDDMLKNKTMTIEQVNKIKTEMAVEYPQIEYKPQAKTTGDINLQKQFATKDGIVGSDESQVIVQNAQTQMVRDNLSKNYSDDVVNSTAKILNNKRFSDIMKATADRMKADDIKGNMAMLQKTIKSEVDKMVSRINKAHGVKLPSSEVEKIYKMKLEDMLKECE